MMSERTKVVATLGPASSTPEVLGGMVEAGLDVVRLNFSHGEKADHLARFELVRSVSTERDRNLAILVDLQGPKIRVGLVDDNGVKLDRGRATRSCWTTGPSACGSWTSTGSGSAAGWSGAASSSPARA